MPVSSTYSRKEKWQRQKSRLSAACDSRLCMACHACDSVFWLCNNPCNERQCRTPFNESHAASWNHKINRMVSVGRKKTAGIGHLKGFSLRRGSATAVVRWCEAYLINAAMRLHIIRQPAAATFPSLNSYNKQKPRGILPRGFEVYKNIKIRIIIYQQQFPVACRRKPI